MTRLLSFMMRVHSATLNVNIEVGEKGRMVLLPNLEEELKLLIYY